MYKKYFIILFLIFTACGHSLSGLDSMLKRQPMVVAVTPADENTVNADTRVSLIFSVPINPTSINQRSFAVMKVTNKNQINEDLIADVSIGEVGVVPGSYEFSDGYRNAVFTPQDSLESGKTYAVIATTDINNPEGFPLNQLPGESPTPFWSSFIIEGESKNETNEDQTVAEETNPTDLTSFPMRPAKLIINELLYDASGDEMDGNLFIELFGDADTDISDYNVVFINGSDGATTETIKISGGSIIPDDGIFLIADTKTSAVGETNIAGADMLDNFDPQNGPDCVQLQDDHGVLLDAVGYGSQLPELAGNGLACYEGSPSPDAPAGKSLSRSEGLDTNDNSIDFITLDISTPGLL